MTNYRSNVWANGDVESPLIIKDEVDSYLDNNTRRIGFFPNGLDSVTVYHKGGISIVVEYKRDNIGISSKTFLDIDLVSEVTPVEGLAKIIKELSPELKMVSE